VRGWTIRAAPCHSRSTNDTDVADGLGALVDVGDGELGAPVVSAIEAGAIVAGATEAAAGPHDAIAMAPRTVAAIRPFEKIIGTVPREPPPSSGLSYDRAEG